MFTQHFMCYSRRLKTIGVASTQLRAPEHHWMPRRVNAWVTPVVDTSLALDSAVQQDQRDPRVLGQGPCGRSHEQPLPLDLRENLPYLKWSSNQYGRWADCQRCAVRLLYYPRQGQF